MRPLTKLDEWSAANVVEVFALADAYSADPEARGPEHHGDGHRREWELVSVPGRHGQA